MKRSGPRDGSPTGGSSQAREKPAGERRRFNRVPFKAKVTLTAGDGQWSVALIDISLKGMMGFEWTNIDLDSLVESRRLLELDLGDAALIERDLAKLFQTATA